MACKWHSAPLGELISYIGKGVAPKYINDGPDATMVLGQKCVRNQALQYEQARFHNSAEKAVNPDKEVRKGDILVNATGVGSAGRVAQVMADPSRQCITDGHVITLRAKDINPFYLGYFVKSKQNTIELMAEGSTGQTEMNRQRLQNEIIVTFPESKDLQKRIAEYGLAIDKKIAVNNQLNDYLADFASTVFQNQASHIEERIALFDIADIKYGKGLAKNELVEDGYPVFGGNGQIGFYSKYLYEEPQILISCRGAASGKVLVSLPKSFITSNSLIIELKDRRYYEYLKQYFMLHQLYDYATGSAQPQITIDGLRHLTVPYPPFDLIKTLTNQLKAISDCIYSNDIENQALSRLRDTLLPKLMSGEIDVSKVDLTQLTNNHLSGCGSFCSVCCPSGLASEFHEWFREHSFFGYGHLCKADLG